MHIDLRGLYEGDLWAATSTVSFTCREPGASTFVDCVGDVSSVTLNGEALDPSTAERGRIPLPDLRADNVLVVSHTQSDTGIGHRDPEDRRPPRQAGLRLVDASSPTWPATRSPASTSPTSRRRTASWSTPTRRWTVTSNSAPDRVEDLDGDRGGGRRWTFGDTPRLSTYVTVVNAGPFHEIRSQRGGYDLGLYSRQSLQQFLERDAEELFDLTDRGLAFFGERFGQPFAQERYDQVFVPNMGGAMENWGSVTWTDSVLYRSTPTYGQRAVRAQILLHEMAHMWFGDLVTMRWWDDLWLNEAFASWASNWAGVNCTEFTDEWATFLAGGEDGRLPPGHVPGHPPDPRRRPGRRAGDGELRRDHLHQGRQRAEAADGVRRRGPVRRGPPRSYFRDHAWGNTVPRRPDVGDRRRPRGATSTAGPSPGSTAPAPTSSGSRAAPITATSPDDEEPRPHRLDVGSYAVVRRRARPGRHHVGRDLRHVDRPSTSPTPTCTSSTPPTTPSPPCAPTPPRSGCCSTAPPTCPRRSTGPRPWSPASRCCSTAS